MIYQVSPLVIRLGAIALGFLVATAYVPAVIGASIPTGYLVIMFLVPIFLLVSKIRITTSHLYGALFLFYVYLSLCWTFRLNIGFFIFLQTFALATVFCLGSAIEDLTDVFRGMALGLGVSALIGLYQLIDVNIIYNSNTMGYPSGLFINHNVFCETSIIMFVALIVLKMYWWVPVTIPGIIFVQSRAAMLALIVSAFAWLFNRNRIFALLLIPPFVLAITAYYFNYRFDLSSVDERFAIWNDTIRGLTLFGHGVGSYEITFPAFAKDLDINIVRPAQAHNDLLQLIYEFGIGVILLIPLAWNILKIKCDEKIILYCIGIISIFNFPMHIPITAFIACLVAGYITRFDVAYEPIRFSWRPILFTRFKV